MKLKELQVTNFKSVLDSGTFTTDDLTVLVGKNEAGKSALLQALYKLKPVETDKANFLDTEYPRLFWSDYQDSSTYDNVLTTKWTLDPAQVDWLNERLCPNAIKSSEVIIRKGYENEHSIEV